MASSICMATTPVVGSSFVLFSFRAILIFLILTYGLLEQQLVFGLSYAVNMVR